MSQIYRVTIEIEVTDPEVLRETAAAVAESNMVGNWHDLRGEDDPIGSDLRMILDPGVSPDGTNIIDCSSEYVMEGE